MFFSSYTHLFIHKQLVFEDVLEPEVPLAEIWFTAGPY